MQERSLTIENTGNSFMKSHALLNIGELMQQKSPASVTIGKELSRRHTFASEN
jgi:hypothetical protein